MSSDSLMDALRRIPEQFDFFQAVWLLEQAAGSAVGGNPSTDAQDVAGGHVRFRAQPSLAYPPGEVAGLQQSGSGPVELFVSFLGLTGPAGILPEHYTSLLLEREHPHHADHAMREFFDLFNDRAVRMYYLAWRKHRISEEYQRVRQTPDARLDRFSEALFAITGLGSRSLRQVLPFDPELVLYFGGLFADACRTACGLQQMLATVLQLPVDIQEFRGRWLDLPTEVQSQLPSVARPLGRNLELGTNAVCGARTWEEQSLFRVRLGPVSREQFGRLLPGEGLIEFAADFIRFYAGPSLDFELQILLPSEKISPPVLGLGEDSMDDNAHTIPLRCGYSIWLGVTTPRTIADDAVFRFSGLPDK
ncbi:MAG: type VI secretion system baseplate subunit TssG [Planctomycetia bacterium]